MPKDQESLEESREIRALLISKYGFIPESIIAANWSMRTDRRGQKTYLDERKRRKQVMDKILVRTRALSQGGN